MWSGMSGTWWRCDTSDIRGAWDVGNAAGVPHFRHPRGLGCRERCGGATLPTSAWSGMSEPLQTVPKGSIPFGTATRRTALWYSRACVLTTEEGGTYEHSSRRSRSRVQAKLHVVSKGARRPLPRHVRGCGARERHCADSHVSYQGSPCQQGGGGTRRFQTRGEVRKGTEELPLPVLRRVSPHQEAAGGLPKGGVGNVRRACGAPW